MQYNPKKVFKLDYGQGHIYEMDYATAVVMVNRVFDWDYVDFIIEEISKEESSDEKQTQDYLDYFVEDIKAGISKTGDLIWYDDNEKVERQKELEAYLNE